MSPGRTGTSERDWYFLCPISSDVLATVAGFFYARRNKTSFIRRALADISQRLKDAARDFNIAWTRPSAFICDDCSRQFSAIKAVFGEDVHVALCTWHFAKCLLSNLRRFLPASTAERVVGSYWSAVYAPTTPNGWNQVLGIVRGILVLVGANSDETDKVVRDLRGMLAML